MKNRSSSNNTQCDYQRRSNFPPSLKHDLLTAEEAASCLSVHVLTLRHWTWKKLIPHYKVGAQTRYDLIEIWDYLLPPQDGYPEGAGAAAGIDEIVTQFTLADFLRVSRHTIMRNLHKLPRQRPEKSYVFVPRRVLDALRVDPLSKPAKIT